MLRFYIIETGLLNHVKCTKTTSISKKQWILFGTFYIRDLLFILQMPLNYNSNNQQISFSIQFGVIKSCNIYNSEGSIEYQIKYCENFKCKAISYYFIYQISLILYEY